MNGLPPGARKMPVIGSYVVVTRRSPVALAALAPDALLDAPLNPLGPNAGPVGRAVVSPGGRGAFCAPRTSLPAVYCGDFVSQNALNFAWMSPVLGCVPLPSRFTPFWFVFAKPFVWLGPVAFGA